MNNWLLDVFQITKIVAETSAHDSAFTAVAQAQLQKDNERFAKREQEIRKDERERLLQLIEDKMAIRAPEGDIIELFLDKEDWEDLKGEVNEL